MPKPYRRPKPMMDEESPEGQDASTPMAEEAKNEPTAIFLTKEQVGNAKVGDVISFTVKDIDPQTGEVEAYPAESGKESAAPVEDMGGSPLDKMDSMEE